MHPIPVTDITEAPSPRRFAHATGSSPGHPVVEGVLASLRPWLPWVHVAMFLLFLAVLVVPVYLPESSEQATFLDDGRVLANYLLWGVWFPLVFFSVVVTGRSWCGFLCPMGAASELANRYGLKMQTPAWIRWPGTPILSFIVITLLGQTTGVRDHPEAALKMFGGTFVLAIIAGWLWGRNKRVWCRHLCPIGLLLGGVLPFRCGPAFPPEMEVWSRRTDRQNHLPYLHRFASKASGAPLYRVPTLYYSRTYGGPDIVISSAGSGTGIYSAPWTGCLGSPVHISGCRCRFGWFFMADTAVLQRLAAGCRHMVY